MLVPIFVHLSMQIGWNSMLDLATAVVIWAAFTTPVQQWGGVFYFNATDLYTSITHFQEEMCNDSAEMHNRLSLGEKVSRVN